MEVSSEEKVAPELLLDEVNPEDEDNENQANNTNNEPAADNVDE